MSTDDLKRASETLRSTPRNASDLAVAGLLWQIYVLPEIAVSPSVRLHADTAARAVLNETSARNDIGSPSD